MSDHELQRLKAVHHRILDLQLQGLSAVAIARELGLSENGVGRIVRSPLFQDQLARRRRDQDRLAAEAHAQVVAGAKERLAGAAVTAAERLIGLLDSESENIRLKTASEILDRTVGADGTDGTGAKIVINELNVNALVTALAEAKAAAQTENDNDDDPEPDGSRIEVDVISEA